jgi:hypothetical protein
MEMDFCVVFCGIATILKTIGLRKFATVKLYKNIGIQTLFKSI